MLLPENVFFLDEPADYPTEEQADEYGTVLYFSPLHGWMTESYLSASEMHFDFRCTHWTFTPTKPS
jgi:hypothetical protein